VHPVEVTLNGGDPIVLQVFAKAQGDTMITVLEEDFNDIPNGELPEGWTLTGRNHGSDEGFATVTSVQNGKLVFGRQDGDMLILPEYIGAFGAAVSDYSISFDDDTPSGGVNVLLRYGAIDANNQSAYGALVRNFTGATAPAFGFTAPTTSRFILSYFRHEPPNNPVDQMSPPGSTVHNFTGTPAPAVLRDFPTGVTARWTFTVTGDLLDIDVNQEPFITGVPLAKGTSPVYSRDRGTLGFYNMNASGRPSTVDNVVVSIPVATISSDFNSVNFLNIAGTNYPLNFGVSTTADDGAIARVGGGLSGAPVYAGTKVSFDITPDEGFGVDTVLSNWSGLIDAKYDSATGILTGIMPVGGATVTVAFVAQQGNLNFDYFLAVQNVPQRLDRLVVNYTGPDATALAGSSADITVTSAAPQISVNNAAGTLTANATGTYNITVRDNSIRGAGKAYTIPMHVRAAASDVFYGVEYVALYEDFSDVDDGELPEGWRQLTNYDGPNDPGQTRFQAAVQDERLIMESAASFMGMFGLPEEFDDIDDFTLEYAWQDVPNTLRDGSLSTAEFWNARHDVFIRLTNTGPAGATDIFQSGYNIGMMRPTEAQLSGGMLGWAYLTWQETDSDFRRDNANHLMRTDFSNATRDLGDNDIVPTTIIANNAEGVNNVRVKVEGTQVSLWHSVGSAPLVPFGRAKLDRFINNEVASLGGAKDFQSGAIGFMMQGSATAIDYVRLILTDAPQSAFPRAAWPDPLKPAEFDLLTLTWALPTGVSIEDVAEGRKVTVAGNDGGATIFMTDSVGLTFNFDENSTFDFEITGDSVFAPVIALDFAAPGLASVRPANFGFPSVPMKGSIDVFSVIANADDTSNVSTTTLGHATGPFRIFIPGGQNGEFTVRTLKISEPADRPFTFSHAFDYVLANVNARTPFSHIDFITSHGAQNGGSDYEFSTDDPRLVIDEAGKTITALATGVLGPVKVEKDGEELELYIVAKYEAESRYTLYETDFSGDALGTLPAGWIPVLNASGNYVVANNNLTELGANAVGSGKVGVNAAGNFEMNPRNWPADSFQAARQAVYLPIPGVFGNYEMLFTADVRRNTSEWNTFNILYRGQDIGGTNAPVIDTFFRTRWSTENVQLGGVNLTSTRTITAFNNSGAPGARVETEDLWTATADNHNNLDTAIGSFNTAPNAPAALPYRFSVTGDNMTFQRTDIPAISITRNVGTTFPNHPKTGAIGFANNLARAIIHDVTVRLNVTTEKAPFAVEPFAVTEFDFIGDVPAVLWTGTDANVTVAGGKADIDVTGATGKATLDLKAMKAYIENGDIDDLHLYVDIEADEDVSITIMYNDIDMGGSVAWATAVDGSDSVKLGDPVEGLAGGRYIIPLADLFDGADYDIALFAIEIESEDDVVVNSLFIGAVTYGINITDLTKVAPGDNIITWNIIGGTTFGTAADETAIEIVFSVDHATANDDDQHFDLPITVTFTNPSANWNEGVDWELDGASLTFDMPVGGVSLTVGAEKIYAVSAAITGGTATAGNTATAVTTAAPLRRIKAGDVVSFRINPTPGNLRPAALVTLPEVLEEYAYSAATGIVSFKMPEENVSITAVCPADPVANLITVPATAQVKSGTWDLAASGVDIPRAESRLVVYTEASASPGTSQWGREAAVDSNGKVVAIRENGAAAQLEIPTGGYIVSVHNWDNPTATDAHRLLGSLSIGSDVEVTITPAVITERVTKTITGTLPVNSAPVNSSNIIIYDTRATATVGANQQTSFIIENGVVTAVHPNGVAAVPSGGYVIHAGAGASLTNASYVTLANNLTVGASVAVDIASNSFTVRYDGIPYDDAELLTAFDIAVEPDGVRNTDGQLPMKVTVDFREKDGDGDWVYTGLITAGDLGVSDYATVVLETSGTNDADPTEVVIAPGGDTAVHIKVTAEDGTTTERYVLNITRGEDGPRELSTVFGEDLDNEAGGDGSTALLAITADVEVDFAQLVDTNWVRTDALTAANLTVTGGTITLYTAAFAAATTAPIPITADGITNVHIKITSEFGTDVYYIISIDRGDDGDADLLTVGGEDINVGTGTGATFDAPVNATVSVPFGVTAITTNFTHNAGTQGGANAVLYNAGFAAPIGTTGTLEVGLATPVYIKVTSEFGTPKFYRVVVTRLENDAKELTHIAGAAITGLTGAGDAAATPATGTITAAFPNEVDEINRGMITATGATFLLYSDDFTTAVDAVELETGANTIRVRVTAADGTHKYFAITVTRDESDENMLLTVLGYTVTSHGDNDPDAGDDEQNPYVVTLSLDPTYDGVTIAEDDFGASPEATVVFHGDDDTFAATPADFKLEEGSNIVFVTVTSESGIDRFVEVRITVAGETDKELNAVAGQAITDTTGTGDAADPFIAAINVPFTVEAITYDELVGGYLGSAAEIFDDEATPEWHKDNGVALTAGAATLVRIRIADGQGTPEYAYYNVSVTRAGDPRAELTGIHGVTAFTGMGTQNRETPAARRTGNITLPFAVNVSGTWVPRAAVTAADIGFDGATGAEAVLYTDATFSTTAASVALTAGEAVPVFIKITAQDTNVVRYYEIAVTRGVDGGNTLSSVAGEFVTDPTGDGSAATPFRATVTVDHTVTSIEIANLIHSGGATPLIHEDATFTATQSSAAISKGANTLFVSITSNYGTVARYIITVNQTCEDCTLVPCICWFYSALFGYLDGGREAAGSTRDSSTEYTVNRDQIGGNIFHNTLFALFAEDVTADLFYNAGGDYTATVTYTTAEGPTPYTLIPLVADGYIWTYDGEPLMYIAGVPAGELPAFNSNPAAFAGEFPAWTANHRFVYIHDGSCAVTGEDRAEINLLHRIGGERVNTIKLVIGGRELTINLIGDYVECGECGSDENPCKCCPGCGEFPCVKCDCGECPDECTCKIGDINANGGIDVGDAYLAFLHVLGLLETQLSANELRRGSLDGSGDITIAMARAIYIFARGLSTESLDWTVSP
jgi:hypothetical protein